MPPPPNITRRRTPPVVPPAKKPPPVVASVKRPLKGDELSTGAGSALVREGLRVTGASLPAGQAPKSVSSTTLSQLTAGATKARGVVTAARDIKTAVDTRPPLEAAQALNASLQRLPEADRKKALEQAAPSLEALVEKTTPLDKKQTQAVVAELAHTAELVGPTGSAALTDPLARAIADGRLEQKGNDANGGVGGVFRGANRHHSEREFVDALTAAKGPGAQLLSNSLVASLANESKTSTGARADRAMGIAGAIATRDASKVPDGGTWSRVSQLGRDVTSAVDGAVRTVEDARQKALDAVIDKTVGLHESMGKLQPGDTLVLGAGGEIDLKYAGETEGAVEVTRNRDGTFTVAGQADLLVGLGAPSGQAKGSGKAGGGARAEFTFENAAAAENGAKALIRGGDSRELAQHLSALEVSGAAATDFDARFGLSGVLSQGVEFSGEVRSTMRIELEHGVPTAVVNRLSVEAGGVGESTGPTGGAGEALRRTLADKFEASIEDGATVTANGRLTFENRVPISSPSSLGDDPLEQATTLLKNPAAVIAGPPSLSVKGELSGDLNGKGYELTSGFQNINPTAIKPMFEQLEKGDVLGAMRATGVEYQFTGGTFTNESRGWLDHELDLVAVKVSGQNYIHHVERDPLTITVS